MTREEALSKAIMTLIYFQAHFCKSKEAVDNTQAIIDTLEQIEQEPKTGRWKRISMDKYVQHAMAYYKCSECGGDIIGEHNYCPNCGARMSEVKE